MEILKIIGVGLLVSIIAVIVKQIKSEFYIIVLLVGGVIIFLMLVEQLKVIIDYFLNIFSKTNLDYSMFITVLKVLGIAYLTEFAHSICVDTGNASIGEKLVLAGKIVIVCLALPIITNLLNIITELL